MPPQTIKKRAWERDWPSDGGVSTHRISLKEFQHLFQAFDGNTVSVRVMAAVLGITAFV
jgi:hypothetical protein